VPGYERKPNEDLSTQYAIVSPGYFTDTRHPLVAGRDFTDEDDSTRPRVAIINETMAEKYWPGLDPIGRKFLHLGWTTRVHRRGRGQGRQYRFLTEPRRPFVYFAYQQGVWDLNLGVALRTEGDPLAFTRALREQVHALDPGIELWAVQAMTDYVRAVVPGAKGSLPPCSLVTRIGGCGAGGHGHLRRHGLRRQASAPTSSASAWPWAPRGPGHPACAEPRL
jgi:hypothetical protein